MTVPAQSVQPCASPGPFRVMVVDDSAVIRGIFRRTLEADPDVSVVASVSNGQFALDSLKREDIEVVVLDIEMPVMDGMTALPRLLEIDPNLKVIMASTLTEKNADVSLRALSVGAADYIPKPSAKNVLNSAGEFQRELLEKVKELGLARRKRAEAGPRLPVSAATSSATAPRMDEPQMSPSLSLRPPSASEPELLAIGSSTGGPQALQSVVRSLGKDFELPILITQHMPPTFTKILAGHLGAASGRSSVEAEDGMIVRNGETYIAPGDFHMIAVREGTDVVLRLITDPPENFCRPSVNPMLRSLANIYGKGLLVVILTGMGQDGLSGGRVVIEAGGTLLAQDEETSIVWGMPGAVAGAGICSAVLPLSELPGKISSLSGKATG